MRDECVAGAWLREDLRVGPDQRHLHRLFIEVEVLLANAAVSHSLLAVVGGTDEDRVVEQSLLLERVESLN